MKILHSSDLHGNYKKLLFGHAETDFDVWVDTGDFFDNYGRRSKTGFRINPVTERGFQTRWFGWKKLGDRFREWLNGRPAVICPGNHDFIHLGHALRSHKCPNVHNITPSGFELLGRKWGGFREINFIQGEWVGESESDQLRELTERTLSHKPDVLITHSPPQGILDEEEGYGVVPLTSALFYGPHQPLAHLFGHCHRDGGSQRTEGGMLFVNSATTTQLLDIP